MTNPWTWKQITRLYFFCERNGREASAECCEPSAALPSTAVTPASLALFITFTPLPATRATSLRVRVLAANRNGLTMRPSSPRPGPSVTWAASVTRAIRVPRVSGTRADPAVKRATAAARNGRVPPGNLLCSEKAHFRRMRVFACVRNAQELNGIWVLNTLSKRLLIRLMNWLKKS